MGAALSARDMALRALDQQRLPGWPPHSVRRLPRPAEGDRCDPRDLALAEQIATGTVTNLLLLEHLIAHYSNRNLRNIDPQLQKVMAMGLYQLRFLARVPARAVVDEAVEQAKRLAGVKAGAFVNAILRRACAKPNAPLPTVAKAEEHAVIALSHPAEVFRRLRKMVGTARALEICVHDNREAPLIIRLIGDTTIEQLGQEGVELAAHEVAGMYVVKGAKRDLLGRWAAEGLAQAQDPTSAMVADHCDIMAGQVVLDRCCGLGTKTLQLSQLAGRGGMVIAMDSNAERCKELGRLAGKRGLANVQVYPVGWVGDLPADGPRFFDRILVDAPCSNSGVLARRPEARYGQGAGALQSLADLQRRILDDSAARLAPGGRMIYSTCSLWQEENEDQVQAFLSRHRDYAVEEQVLTLPSVGEDPGKYHDGGFLAVVRRNTTKEEDS